MSERNDSQSSVVCSTCGLAYTLPEDEVVGNLPHMLLCGHVFCTACLCSLEFGNIVVCPECKVESMLSEDGVEGLQVDSRIIGLIYTAKMNMRKNRNRPRHRKPTPPTPPPEESSEQESDSEKGLEDPLCQAAENLSQLECIHQTLVEGLQVQVKKEKARLVKEIDEVADSALSILRKRKSALLAELAHLEQYFLASRHVLGQVEERRKALRTAIQKAKQVQQHPSLGSYCELDKVLEILQAPVDVQSYDLSCLSLGSGLSCTLNMDGMVQSLKTCFRMTIGNPKALTGEEASSDTSSQLGTERKNWRGSVLHQERRPGRQAPDSVEPGAPEWQQESLGMGPATQAASTSYLSDSPNVIIEEIVEEAEPDSGGLDRCHSDPECSCGLASQVAGLDAHVTMILNVAEVYQSERPFSYRPASRRRSGRRRRPTGPALPWAAPRPGRSRCLLPLPAPMAPPLPPQGKAAFGRPKRKGRKWAADGPPIRQAKVFQEWVLVTHVVNPSHFYVRRVSETRAGVLLSKKISGLCSGERGLFTAGSVVETGSLLFVQWKESMWSRATVMEVFQRGRGESVSRCPVPELAKLRVFFQDYGFSKDISLNVSEGVSVVDSLNQCVRRVDLAVQSEMARWPAQAVRCSLKDIVPADLVKGWCAESQLEFQRVVGSKAVEMLVFGEERDALLVDLKNAPMDRSASDMPLSLRDYLVFLELAMFYSPMAKPLSGGRRPLQFYPPVYPRAMVELNAVVCHINTPSDFYIQLVDNMEYLLLNSKLQDFYSQEGLGGLEVFCPSLEQACAALFEDKVWYRAQIIGFPGNRLVEVRYVDFGNKKILPLSDVRKLKDEYFALPAMAIQCCLADLKPVSSTESWSAECKERFRKLAEQKLMSAMATEIVPRLQALPVRLFEVNEDTGQSTDIAELLVEEELACFRKGVKPQALSVEPAVWDPPFEGLLEGEGDGEAVAPETPAEEGPSQGDAQDLHTHIQLPKNLKDLRVRVTHVCSPGSFYVQLLQMDKHLKKVCEKLKEECAKSEPQPVEWSADMHCAAYINGVWERGQVCSVSSANVAEVLRCDFGNKVKLHINHLRPLQPDLVGCLMLECSLSDIRPAGGRSTWTATACDFISYYMTGAMAIMTIKEDTPERPIPVALYCSNRAGKDVSIADFLVSEGLALKERTRQEVPQTAEKEAGTAEGGFGLKTSEGAGQRAPSPPLHPAPPPPPPPSKPAPFSAAPPKVVRTRPYVRPEAVKTRPYSPPELPHCGLTQMTITAVSEDGVIYAMTRHAERQFEQLKDRLQLHIKTLPRQKPYSWKSVLGCAVMGSDMLWYRGEVLEVIGGHVKVRYVDQGLVENIPVCHVYPTVLCEDIPQLCIPCKLHGITPVGEQWQWDAVALLRELLHTRCVDLQIMELPSDPQGHVTVQVLLDGMTLSRIMVHHQHATFDPSVSATEMHVPVVTSSVTELDDWELNIKVLKDPEPILAVYKYPRLPDKGEHFPVKIKHLRTPNEVFLHPLVEDRDTEENGETLEEALDRVNSSVESLPLLTDFPIEGPCLAEYCDGKYYRAKLLSFEGFDPVKVLVRHVDFGSDDMLPMQRLRQMPAALLRFPCKAIQVRVAGFKPPRVSLEKERVSYRPEWSMKAALEMIDLLHGSITASVVSTDPETAVFLYDEKGALVHLPLVEKGLADFE
ncbi:RING finger protein 17 isoform X1 [Anguilla anguilla]|uniref:RING finger protein 17 isoform X1 n=1 Tax=Anguilla anguilla TaxID=7936 RepID=UPI0015ACCE82|nr:RING finger protein 17 isoform X1 [Anguilla anguilla]